MVHDPVRRLRTPWWSGGNSASTVDLDNSTVGGASAGGYVAAGGVMVILPVPMVRLVVWRAHERVHAAEFESRCLRRPVAVDRARARASGDAGVPRSRCTVFCTGMGVVDGDVPATVADPLSGGCRRLSARR